MSVVVIHCVYMHCTGLARLSGPRQLTDSMQSLSRSQQSSQHRTLEQHVRQAVSLTDADNDKSLSTIYNHNNHTLKITLTELIMMMMMMLAPRAIHCISGSQTAGHTSDSRLITDQGARPKNHTLAMWRSSGYLGPTLSVVPQQRHQAAASLHQRHPPNGN